MVVARCGGWPGRQWFRYWKAEDKARATAHGALHIESAPHGGDDIVRDVQSQAGTNAPIFGREKRLEHVGQVGGIDPFARIPDLGEDLVAVVPDADQDFVAFGISLINSVGRIDQQVEEDLS